MLGYRSIRRVLSLLLVLILIGSVGALPVSAADTDIGESDTYVLDRDANGDSLYQYQSPCMIGYDMDNQYGGNGIPIQAFVFTMYDTRNEEYVPTYCTDINVTAVQGANYRRLNLEDSPFSGSTAGLIRAILKNGFYITPVSGETDEAHAARVNSKVAQIAEAAGVENLTAGEAIAATQCAIWQAAHGPSLSFPKFCRYVFNPTNTKYARLCSYDDLKTKNNDLINATIKTVMTTFFPLSRLQPTKRLFPPVLL